MADRSIAELNEATQLFDDGMTVVYQGNETQKIAGLALKNYARESVLGYAEEAAAIATTDATTAANNAQAARAAAETAQTAAETAANNAQAAQKAAETAQKGAEAAQKGAEAAVGKTSYIGDNGNWYEWDATSGAFVDSGISAKPFPYVQPNEPIDAPEFSLWVDTDEEALYIARAEGVGF